MTNWGALLLGSFLYLGLRRPTTTRRHTAFAVVALAVVVLTVVAIRQHTP